MPGGLALACLEASGNANCTNAAEETMVTALIVALILAGLVASLYWRLRLRKVAAVPAEPIAGPPLSTRDETEQTFEFRAGKFARDSLVENVRHYCRRLGLAVAIDEH